MPTNRKPQAVGRTEGPDPFAFHLSAAFAALGRAAPVMPVEHVAVAQAHAALAQALATERLRVALLEVRDA
ncbi:hypothetical protein [Georgenia sp. AZ-5]|uniref:hypothetical protein n=1 Tax=Georgenia sp. AZ-5 TaxID=3367526 RepID=UPI0037544538